MRGTHQPPDEFASRLEQVIRREIRRRNHDAHVGGTRWVPRSPIRLALAAAVLVVLSVGAGAAAVAAAYEAQADERRDLLLAGYERRAELARRRVSADAEALRKQERQVELGLTGADTLLHTRATLVESEAQVKVLELQLEEVRLTGREPLDAVTAPLVSGRDFVTERWRVQMEPLSAAVSAQAGRLQSVERRVDIGVANPAEVEVIRSSLGELEAARDALGRRIAIRQEFLAGRNDAAQAELRMLEVEAEQRRRATTPKVELSRRNIQRVRAMLERGLATSVQVAEEDLKLLQLETELAKADLDLALIRKQIEELRRAQ